jgi:hypothetical protein
MNEAMREQQFRYDLAANYRREWKDNKGQVELERTLAQAIADQQNDLRTKRLGRWRPFQLAFVLMNLRAMADRESVERGIVDLIWFPTGGGKTEAYLGLTAFTIFWRRLKNSTDAGTTVLMRYTLRLLTTQQFQRAASLEGESALRTRSVFFNADSMLLSEPARHRCLTFSPRRSEVL